MCASVFTDLHSPNSKISVSNEDDLPIIIYRRLLREPVSLRSNQNLHFNHCQMLLHTKRIGRCPITNSSSSSSSIRIGMHLLSGIIASSVRIAIIGLRCCSATCHHRTTIRIIERIGITTLGTLRSNHTTTLIPRHVVHVVGILLLLLLLLLLLHRWDVIVIIEG